MVAKWFWLSRITNAFLSLPPKLTDDVTDNKEILPVLSSHFLQSYKSYAASILISVGLSNKS